MNHANYDHDYISICSIIYSVYNIGVCIIKQIIIKKTEKKKQNKYHRFQKKRCWVVCSVKKTTSYFMFSFHSCWHREKKTLLTCTYKQSCGLSSHAFYLYGGSQWEKSDLIGLKNYCRIPVKIFLQETETSFQMHVSEMQV